MAERRPSSDTVLFTVLLALHLIPIWVFPYFPTQDGPMHVGNARMLQEYFRTDGAVVRQYLSLTPHIEDNWPGHLALVALFQLFAPLTAEKVLLSCYVLLFALCARWTIAAFGRSSLFLAVLLFPFIYNFTLHMGFYNFSFSLIVWIYTLGYWLRHCDTWQGKRTAILALLLTITYFLHPVSFVMAVVLLMFLAATLPSGPRPLWRLYCVGLASLPGSLLLLHFRLTHDSAAPVWTLPFDQKLRYFFTLGCLRSFGRPEVALCLLFLLLLGVTAAVSRRATSGRGWRPEQALATLAGLCTVVYLVAPDEIGQGSFMAARLMFFPLILTLLWLAARSYSLLATRVVRAAGTAVVVLWLGFHAFQHASVQARLDEYLAAARLMRPGATLLAVHRRPPREWYFDPVANISGYYAAERNLVALDNYEAATDHFPLRFRAPCDPASLTGRLSSVTLQKYNSLDGCGVDYIVLFGDLAADLQLALSEYRAIASSPTPGLWQLFERAPGR